MVVIRGAQGSGKSDIAERPENAAFTYRYEPAR